MSLLDVFRSNHDQFYSWFEMAAENNFQAAKLLKKLCQNFKNPKQISYKIHRLEHAGDEICHKIYYQLNKVFVTPIDREDIIVLTQRLDDVADLIYTSASSMNVYHVKRTNQTAKDLSEVIYDSTEQITHVLPKLRHRRSYKEIEKIAIEINRLENKADDLLKEGLSKLFKNPQNPIDVIKWHSIYKSMEEVTDQCEDIADVLHGLITKYA